MLIINMKERPQLQLPFDLKPKSTKKVLFTFEKLVIDPIQVAAFHVRSNSSYGPTLFDTCSNILQPKPRRPP